MENFNIKLIKEIEVAVSGDELAINSCLEQLRPIILKKFRKFHKLNYAEVEDLTQEMLLRLYRRFKSNEVEVTSIEGYISLSVYNLYREYYRNQYKTKKSALEGKNLVMVDDWVKFSQFLSSNNDDYEDNKKFEKQIQIIDKLLSKMLKLEKQIYIKRYHEMKTFDDIAKDLNRPVGTIKSSNFSLKKKLKAQVKNLVDSSDSNINI